jgi:hypothetical protein
MVCVCVFTACGRGDGGDTENNTNNNAINGVYNGDANGTENEEPPSRTLTILACEEYYHVIRQAEEAMAAIYDDFSVEITSYNAGNRDRVFPRLQAEMMTGEMHDIIFWDGQPILQWAAQGFLTDIYTLMDRDPNTSRDDFVTNALTAMETNGGLYAFPLNVAFRYVFINDTLPQSILDMFIGRESISPIEMMDIYVTLMENYGDEFGHLLYARGSMLVHEQELFNHIHNFVDFNNRTSHLNTREFADTLDSILTYLWLEHLSYYQGGTGLLGNLRRTRELTQELVFVTENVQNTMGFAFMDMPYFIHGIPLSDREGRLQLDIFNHCFTSVAASGWTGVWASVCITEAADGPLAWEFTKHLIDAFTWFRGKNVSRSGNIITSWGAERQLSSPIIRSAFQPFVSAAFVSFLDIGYYANFINRPDMSDGDISRLTDNALARLYQYNNMPMSATLNFIPKELYSENFTLLINNVISTNEFAQRTHNAVSLWLMERY